MVPTLAPALAAERRVLTGPAGDLSVYVAGAGAPLLLIHSMNASASAYEVKPVFDGMLGERQVWALDLPGFGFSERTDRYYDRALYIDAIDQVLLAIAQERGACAVDALALSLSSEFLARLALARPGRLRSLALVNPTGFNARAARAAHKRGTALDDLTYEVAGLHAILSNPRWAHGLFAALTSRPSIGFFMRGAFGSRRVDEGLLQYAWQTAHQAGARFAPFAFVCGRLFSRDVVALFQSLQLPVWMPHGVRGDFRDFSGADWARERPNWTVQPFQSGAFPHFEQADGFLSGYRQFLAKVAHIV